MDVFIGGNQKKTLAIKSDNLLKICDLPEPVGDADTGDARFEAFQRYLALSLEASDDGRIAEEIGMLEALNSTEHHQPVVYMNLFTRYSDSGRTHPQDLDKAFDMLKKTTNLLTSPELALSSDQNSLPSSDGHVYEVDDFVRVLIHNGVEFIKEHRVIGRNGQELQAEANVLKALYDLSRTDNYVLNNNINNGERAFRITHQYRSEMLHTLGNICRKMTDNKHALECLRRSDYEMNCHYQKMKSLTTEEHQTEHPPVQEHNYDALLLIVDIRMYEVSVATDKRQQLELLQEVVEEAYRVLDFMIDAKYIAIYRGQIMLGNMLYNQMQLTKRKTQDDLKMAYKLLSNGRDQAQHFSDRDYHLRADKILEKFNEQEMK